MMKKQLLTAVFVLSASLAHAQDVSPATEDEIALARDISERATVFADTIGGLSVQLNSLPDDMAGMEALYDEMILEVDGILESVSPDSDLASGVGTLLETAETKRSEWQARCDETNAARDCARVSLWDERVAKAIEQQDEFETIADVMKNAREVIVENRTYGIDDLELRLFDSAQQGLDSAIGEMSSIADSMVALAENVGGPDFEGQETN